MARRLEKPEPCRFERAWHIIGRHSCEKDTQANWRHRIIGFEYLHGNKAILAHQTRNGFCAEYKRFAKHKLFCFIQNKLFYALIFLLFSPLHYSSLLQCLYFANLSHMDPCKHNGIVFFKTTIHILETNVLLLVYLLSPPPPKTKYAMYSKSKLSLWSTH